MEFKEFTGKTVDDAITEATLFLGTTSDKIEYEVVEEGSNGLLGLFSKKNAVIRARVKDTKEDHIRQFLSRRHLLSRKRSQCYLQVPVNLIMLVLYNLKEEQLLGLVEEVEGSLGNIDPADQFIHRGLPHSVGSQAIRRFFL